MLLFHVIVMMLDKGCHKETTTIDINVPSNARGDYSNKAIGCDSDHTPNVRKAIANHMFIDFYICV